MQIAASTRGLRARAARLVVHWQSRPSPETEATAAVQAAPEFALLRIPALAPCASSWLLRHVQVDTAELAEQVAEHVAKSLLPALKSHFEAGKSLSRPRPISIGS